MNKMNLLVLMAAMLLIGGCKSKPVEPPVEPQPEGATVYMTTQITPESLVRIYEALGVKAEGRVAVKISTGEAGGNNYLKPELIGPLVQLVNGKIVECNTAYAGKR